MKLNFTPKYFITLLLLITFSCSVKNSTLKKGAEMEKLGNFKQASELYLGVLYRKPNLPEIENALRRSAQLHISETAFSIATKNEKGEKEGVVNEYYNLNTFVNQVNAFCEFVDAVNITEFDFTKLEVDGRENSPEKPIVALKPDLQKKMEEPKRVSLPDEKKEEIDG